MTHQFPMQQELAPHEEKRTGSVPTILHRLNHSVSISISQQLSLRVNVVTFDPGEIDVAAKHKKTVPAKASKPAKAMKK
jgi:hypothetical protein